MEHSKASAPLPLADMARGTNADTERAAIEGSGSEESTHRGTSFTHTCCESYWDLGESWQAF